VATRTTTGYGDIYPITTGGRIFTFLVLMLGLGIVAVPTGMVASPLSQARAEELQHGSAKSLEPDSSDPEKRN
jgi:voltage-gated potassium channel